MISWRKGSRRTLNVAASLLSTAGIVSAAVVAHASTTAPRHVETSEAASTTRDAGASPVPTSPATSFAPLPTLSSTDGVPKTVEAPAVSSSRETATSVLAAPSFSTTVTAGEVVFADTEVTSIVTATPARPDVAFLNSAGAVLDVVRGQTESASVGTWDTTVPVVALAPAGAASALLQVVSTGLSSIRTQDPKIRVTAAPSAGLVGPLHTSGNQILDANGDPVTLRGVDLTDLLSPYSSVNEHEFEAAKAWGANLVRVSLNEALWLKTSCTYSSSYESKVDDAVEWITSLGMVALLDLHFNAPITCQQGAQQQMADDPGSLDFWSQVASRYGQNPLVAFDLYNEPHDISDSTWLNGGQAVDLLVPYSAAGMQSLYDAVRNAGASGLVFVSGNNWANTVPSTLVSGTNIVYSVHAYTCPTVAPPACTSTNPYDAASMLDSWVKLSATYPVFVGEFGWPNPNDAGYMNNVIAFASAHGWGWDAFMWDTSTPGVFDLVGQTPPTGEWEPTVSGMPVLASMAGLAS